MGDSCGPIKGIRTLGLCRPPVGTADPFDVVSLSTLSTRTDTTVPGSRAATGASDGLHIRPTWKLVGMIVRGGTGDGPLWLLCWFHGVLGVAVHCSRSRHHTVSYLDSC